ncbi:MAG: hypothetical protein LC689_20985 [Myxococcales bacterium]|nr:hypothetical protein [Myxococcales bacterium]
MRFDGSYRLRFNGDSNLPLDETGFSSGQKTWAEHRLRLTPKIVEIGEHDAIEIQASFDILSGEVAGDVANDFRGYGLIDRSQRTGLKPEGFDFRYLFTQIRTGVGLLQIGQMPSQWGMGMVANNGNGEGVTDFGDPRYGDIVDGALFATRPLIGFMGPKSEFAQHVAVAVAAEAVYRDRYANLIVKNGGGLQIGDVAWQGVGALVYDASESTRAGLYVARRVQTFAASGGDLHIWVFDAHLRHSQELRGLVLSVEAEAAQIYGGTSHAPNLSALGTTRVSQQGAALRAGVTRGQIEGEIEGGYASGDANPFDAQANNFQFNRDYKVGLVLFDEVLMFQSQNAARRLSDPSLLGAPPPGLDLLPTEGAVSNALYLKPTLRFKPPMLGGAFRFVGSALFARAPQPVLDAYQALVSSASTNAFGHAAGRNYGVEVDLGVGYHARVKGPLGFEAGLQYGYLFPGDAFTRADGSRMPAAHAMQVRTTLVF